MAFVEGQRQMGFLPIVDKLFAPRPREAVRPVSEEADLLSEAEILLKAAMEATRAASNQPSAAPQAPLRTYESTFEGDTYRIIIPILNKETPLTITYPSIQLDKKGIAFPGRMHVILPEGKLPTAEFFPKDSSPHFAAGISAQSLHLLRGKIESAGEFDLVGRLGPSQVHSLPKAA